MITNFSDRTVIVTGAAHDIGHAIAHGFARRGGHTWPCDVLDETLAETARLAEDASRTCTPGTSTSPTSPRCSPSAKVEATGAERVNVLAGALRGRRRISRVSTDPEDAGDVRRAAAFLVTRLRFGEGRRAWADLLTRLPRELPHA